MLQPLSAFLRAAAACVLATTFAVPAVTAAQGRPVPRQGSGAIPVSVPTPAPAPAASNKGPAAYDRQRLIAGHYLRRFGFGPSPKDLKAVLKAGPDAWLEKQLKPETLDDSRAEGALPPADPYDVSWQRLNQRWFIRMAYSKRQAQEKMTLVWNQLFNVSESKIDHTWMYEYEGLLRKNALGNFRTLLVDVTRNNAMLVWLDNSYNNGNQLDDNGNRIPPNENYARELLQLYSMGPVKLNMDGTPVLGGDGQPLASYTEDDVKAVARALTGHFVNVQYEPEYKALLGASQFEPDWHDADPKTIMGTQIPGRQGRDGQQEVEDVVDVLMQNPSTAPFISKQLIQQLATETPTPGYVGRVAAVFKSTNGDIKSVLRAIAHDPEFTSDAVIRTQVRTPIEHVVGAVRALDGTTRGLQIAYTSYSGGQPLMNPPTVFGNYRPGSKISLVNSATVLRLDSELSNYFNGYKDDDYWDSTFDAALLIRKRKLRTPEQAVDYLADAMLVGPIAAETRRAVLDYMGGQVTEEKVRGAAWLIACSSDYLKN